MNENTKKRHIPFWITITVIGAILLTVGTILTLSFGVDKYVDTEDIERTFDGTEITSVSIESGIANLKVEKSNSNNIYVKGTNLIKNKYTFSADNGELKISSKKKFNIVNLLPMKKSPELTVQLPEKIYDSLDLNGGVGEISFIGLTFNKADIDCGVGKSVFKDIKVLEKADIDLGVGQTRFENCEFNKSDIDSGVGEFYYGGKILGDTKMDLGIGEVTFDIDGYSNEYDIDCDEGAGKIKINESYSSTVTHEPIKLDIDGGLGEVIINFK